MSTHAGPGASAPTAPLFTPGPFVASPLDRPDHLQSSPPLSACPAEPSKPESSSQLLVSFPVAFVCGPSRYPHRSQDRGAGVPVVVPILESEPLSLFEAKAVIDGELMSSAHTLWGLAKRILEAQKVLKSGGWKEPGERGRI